MLTNASVYPTLPVTNLNRSRDFYGKKLGLQVEDDRSPEGILYKAGDNTKLFIYQRPPSPASHTLAAFRLQNIEATIDELTKNGVVFEHYDYPDLKTDDKGIATRDQIKAAWFKDPDGNILGVTQENT